MTTVRLPVAALRDTLEQLVAEKMAAHLVPGVAVGVVRGDERLVVTAGVTNVAAPVPVDHATLFQIGSTTKTLTASVVMRLVQAGQLQLDVPIRRYVPELRMADPEAAAQLTARDLLTHMGGHDGDLFEDFGDDDQALSRACAGMEVLPQLAPLRSIWNYSNAGFTVIGRAIETVTGTSYETACREWVLDPLGMAHSAFSAAEAITERVAVGHRSIDGTVAVTRPWELPRAIAPAGGLAASIEDQLTYAQLHLGHRPDLLDQRTLALMQSPLVAAGGGRARACGLSWLLQATPGLLAHGGETNGQMSSFALLPDHDLAIAAATNGQDGALVHTAIVKWLLRTLVDREPAPRPAPAPPSATPAEIVGSYGCRLQTVTIDVDTKGGLTLSCQPTELQLAMFPEAQPVPPHLVTQVGQDGLHISDGPLSGARGEFLRDGSGVVTWIRILGRLHRRTA